MTNWGKTGLVAGGILLGHYGLKILGSKPMKMAYAGCTAAVLRAKDEVVKDVVSLAEGCADIAHSGQKINESWQALEAEARLEEAKALVANAESLKKKSRSEK